MDKGSRRQIWLLVFVALLAPASTLPPVLAGAGGALGWLAPLLTAPVALAGAWCYRRLGPEGLRTALRAGLGRLAGPVLCLYYLWAAGLAALTAGGCVDRLARTDYADAASWLLALALAAAAAYLIRKGRGAFLRTVELIYLALLVVLALVLVLGGLNLRGENLAPARGDGLGAVRGVVPAAASLAVGGLAGFFPREEEPGGGPGWRWLLGWCLTAAGLTAVVLGTLGANITARGPQPFFLALQGLGIEGGFQRLEALVTAAWVLSDLALLGMAALAAVHIAGDRKWAAWPIIGAAFVGGWLLDNQTVAPLAPWLHGVNLVLGGGIPIGLAAVSKRRMAYLVSWDDIPPQNIEEQKKTKK